MKYIAKMMLAALASIAIAVPAYAWDFSASGSASAQWSQSSIKGSTSADTATVMAVADSGGAISIVSANTDGDNTVTLTYKIDYDGGLDEGFTVTGVSKVGDWTATASTNHQKQNNGVAASSEDETNISLTDGTMTIILGGAAHLSDQNVSSGSVAGGDTINMDQATADYDVGAYVGTFKGVSLGYKVNDTTTVTVALQFTDSDNDTLGIPATFADGELSTHGSSGQGIGLSTVVGPATIGFTYASAKSVDQSAGGSLSTTTSATTMGLGVAVDLGDIDPFLSYGSAETKADVANDKVAITAYELGLTYAIGTDSVVVFMGNSEHKTTSAGVAGEADKWTGMEVGYTTTVGAADLGVGYGTLAKSMTDATYDGYSASYIEVQLDFSF